jgi:hypothetical protein
MNSRVKKSSKLLLFRRRGVSLFELFFVISCFGILMTAVTFQIHTARSAHIQSVGSMKNQALLQRLADAWRNDSHRAYEVVSHTISANPESKAEKVPTADPSGSVQIPADKSRSNGFHTIEFLLPNERKVVYQTGERGISRAIFRESIREHHEDFLFPKGIVFQPRLVESQGGRMAVLRIDLENDQSGSAMPTRAELGWLRPFEIEAALTFKEATQEQQDEVRSSKGSQGSNLP